MFISVIVPTRNRYNEILGLIDSLRKQLLLPDELIIVDSSDTKNQYIENLIKNNKEFLIKYIYTNLKGSSVQRNIGIKNLNKNADIIFFFDDDVILENDYIKKIIDIYENDKNKNIGGIDGYPLIDGKLKYSKNKEFKLQEVKSLYGCNMSFRTEAIRNVWFDENLALYSWLEDWDFSYRIGKKFKLFRCNQAYLYHFHSQNGRVDEKKFGFMQLANRYYLYKKNGLFTYKEYLIYLVFIVKNLIRAFKSTYRNRLYGNLIAFFNIVINKNDLNAVYNLKDN